MITVDRYINKASCYLGVVEDTPKHTEIVKAYNAINPLPRGYRLSTSDAWCAAFVSAVANLCGYGSGFPYECSVQAMVNIAKSKKMWVEGVTPRRGWLVVYDWQKDGRADHVGIVSTVATKNIKVIEGNYKNKVGIRTIAKDSETIKGYIALKFLKEGDTNITVARDVIAGKYGNGETRRKKLQKAGYDPDAIQAIVNKLIK